MNDFYKDILTGVVFVLGLIDEIYQRFNAQCNQTKSLI